MSDANAMGTLKLDPFYRPSMSTPTPNPEHISDPSHRPTIATAML